MNHKRNIFEGLRSGDLENYVSEIFSVDRYKSKMGEDADVLVLNFKVKEKYPAIDLMEFIEKGYDFILDADMSAGEETDGQYQVFVEIERTPKLEEQLSELLGGISQLCNVNEWRFKYQKSNKLIPFTNETISEQIPLTPERYASKVLEIKEGDIKKFFDQGAVELELKEDNTLVFRRPFAGDLHAKFLAIGNAKDVEKKFPGALSLDESSQSQVFFLNKYLGNYEINKIGNKFLIRNGKQAVVIEKDRW
jgi:hypothetical protein